MCAACMFSVGKALHTPAVTTRQGRMLLENLLAAPRRHTATLHEHLRVKLHKTKRKLAESPAIDIANTCERLRIAPPSRRWLRCIEIRWNRCPLASMDACRRGAALELKHC